MTLLHNRIDKRILKQRLAEETFKRITISFYRYIIIEDVDHFRDQFYKDLSNLNCLGRLYVAREGINAQMSVPEDALEAFLQLLEANQYLKDMPIKYAVEDDGKSFYKLIVRKKKRILADGLPDDSYDVTNVGRHLTAMEFHELSAKDETLVIDMRNSYESEIGHFENAYCPEADTFREEIQLVTETFKDQKDKKILLYCTGGIRCEKASAFMKHVGFKDVNQLLGGVIEYARQIDKAQIKSRYVGRNFVFDGRMSERIDDRIVGTCHQCGSAADSHVNCQNDACHLLFIQCETCSQHFDACCSEACKSFIQLPAEVQLKERKLRRFNGSDNSYKGLRKRLDSACVD